MTRRNALLILAAALAALADAAGGHEQHPYGITELDWPVKHVQRVLTSTQDFQNDAVVLSWTGLGRVENIDGRRCLVGAFFLFDIDDGYSYDIDETVTLELLFDRRSTEGFKIIYDHAVQAPAARAVTFDNADTGPWRRATADLDRARFANRLHAGMDLGIAATGTTLSYDAAADHELTLCNLSIRRSGTTSPPAPTGTLELQLRETRTDTPTAARIGLYDSGGRMPLPGNDAVVVRRFTDRVRQIPLVSPREMWPGPGRYVFYVDDSYTAQVPAGRYRLVASKGPEYRVVEREVVIFPGAHTQVNVDLEHWIDMPARGWISGDGHVHIGRSPADNPVVSAQMRAEDLHITNLLQMSNILRIYFPQYAFGVSGHYSDGRHTLVSGQESPRTGHRGHTISLNTSLYHDPQHYFLYHETARQVRSEGGLYGYAHVMFDAFHASRGLALDVPMGLVDFVEVLQFGELGTRIWYDFLNLGYRLAPVAGSDFPYINAPGTERSYVFTGGENSPADWFAGLQSGKTFVTNAPMLNLEVNEHGLGEEVVMEAGNPLQVTASAAVNPGFDQLDRLELVVHGEVVAAVTSRGGSENLHLEHTLFPEQSCWLAVRAFGKDAARAHSAPVYVLVDGNKAFWKYAEVPQLVKRYRSKVEELLSGNILPHEDLENWSTGDALKKAWKDQRPLLARYAREVLSRYDALMDRWNSEPR